MAGLLFKRFDRSVTFAVTPKTTLFSAVFASATRVSRTYEYGLSFNENAQRTAGRVADVPTLQMAHGLGLTLTRMVLFGAAESASVPKLQWLHTEQGCPLPEDISDMLLEAAA